MKLGPGLTGDTVGGRYIPVVARLEQNVRLASGLSNFVASLARDPERAAGTAYLPHDRRARFHRSPLREPYGADGSRGDASLAPAFEPGRQPRREPARAERVGSAGTDSAFFAQFDQALAQLEQQCRRMCVSVCGAGQLDALACRAAMRSMAPCRRGTDRSPFLPLDSSTAGKAIDTTVARIRQGLNTFGIGGFILRSALASDTLQRQHLRADPPQPDPNGFGLSTCPFARKLPLPAWATVRASPRTVRLLTAPRICRAAAGAGAGATGAKDSASELLRTMGRPYPPAGPGGG